MAVVDEFISLLGFEEKSGSEKTSKSFTARLENVGKASFKAVAALSAAALAVGFFTRKLTAGADESGKFSQSFGTVADHLEEIGFVAKRAGADAQTVMKELAAETARTGETVNEALARLTRDFEGLDPRQQQQLAQSLGISQDLLRVLQQGSGAIAEQRARFRELGGGISDTARKNAAEFNNVLTDSLALTDGLSNQFQEKILPTLTDILRRINDMPIGLEDAGEAMLAVANLLGKIVDGWTALFDLFSANKDTIKDMFDNTLIGRFIGITSKLSDILIDQTKSAAEGTEAGNIIEDVQRGVKGLTQDRAGLIAPVSSSTQNQVDNRQTSVTFNINESKNPRATARAVSDKLGLVGLRNQITPADGVT